MITGIFRDELRAHGSTADRDIGARIGRKAIRALYIELALYPKPGLVSPVDAGAHADMDRVTFMRSLFSLRGYFRDIAVCGARRGTFDELQRVGRTAECRMFAATRGINTHRGSIFTLGLLAAAAGALLVRGESLQDQALGQFVKSQWGGELRAAAIHAAQSNGTAVLRRYGAGGARHQAAEGFPQLFELALPTLKESLLSTGDYDRSLVQTFFTLLSELDDTNLLHRGGVAGLEYAKARAQEFRLSGGVHHRLWHSHAEAIHRDFIARNLSPGGVADLLAAAIFVNDLLH